MIMKSNNDEMLTLKVLRNGCLFFWNPVLSDWTTVYVTYSAVEHDLRAVVVEGEGGQVYGEGLLLQSQ